MVGEAGEHATKDKKHVKGNIHVGFENAFKQQRRDGGPSKEFVEAQRKEAAEKRKAEIEKVREETDPQRIMELAMVHQEITVIGAMPNQGRKVIGYDEKFAAIANQNTPTTFLLFLYHYPERHFHHSDRVGPHSQEPAPFVTSNIRDAAIKEMDKRGWTLGAWEKGELSAAECALYERQLAEDRMTYTAGKAVEKDTPLGKVSKQLTESLLRD